MLQVRADARTRLTEPVHGFRTWTLAGTRDASVVHLLPIADSRRPWPVREPLHAECARRRHHRVPALDCTCGIHATAETDLLRRTRDPAVLGTVAVWGRIAEHEHGLRAEYGYPQRLSLVCQLCFWQSEAVRSIACEVVIRHRSGRMVPLCMPHLDLCERFGYPVPLILDARVVERSLLDAYAVDVLRLAVASGAEEPR